MEQDINLLKKQLDGFISSKKDDSENASKVLSSLKQMHLTLDVLQSTRIGMTVNNYRKFTTDEKLQSVSKSLIKQWKKLLPGDKDTESGNSTPSQEATKRKTESPPQNGDSGVSASPASNGGASSAKIPKTQSAVADLKSDVRVKCREMIEAALRGNDMAEYTLGIKEIAEAVESAIYDEFKSTEMKYKNRVRSRISNLKDPRNPELRKGVLLGVISAQRLATMTAEEMASEEVKNLRQKLTKESIDEHQLAKTGGTPSEMLKCSRCKKNNCSYNQVQTRSADEPMTTFVYCNECGHRWKFC